MNLGALATRLAKLEAQYVPGGQVPDSFNIISVNADGTHAGGYLMHMDGREREEIPATGEQLMPRREYKSTGRPVKLEPVAEPEEQMATLSIVPESEPVPGTRGYRRRWGTKSPLND